MVGGPPPTRVEPDRGGDVAVVLTGGGARAAYLAAFPGTQAEAIERLATLWLNLSVDQVFRVDTSSLLGNMARWGVRLVSGGSALAPEVRGLVDTAPLWTSLAKVFKLSEGAIARGISHQLDARRLWALAIVTSNYATGQSVVWIQGRDLRDWERPTRREPNHRDRTRPCHGVGGVAALLPRGSPSGSMAWRRRYSSDRAVLTCHSPRGHSHPGALDTLCRIARGSRPTDDGGIPGTASDFRAVARRDLS